MRLTALFSLSLWLLLSCQPDSVATSLKQVEESHPYQTRLLCKRAPGSVLVGVMYDISGFEDREIARFESGHVGACELALRASRRGKVCVHRNWSYRVIDIDTGATEETFGNDFESCRAYTRGWRELRTEHGYVQYIPENELEPFLRRLPHVSEPVLDDVLRSSDTIWYDEASMTFVYQDSFGDPKGLRANRVGYDVGSNASEPDIRALTEYFTLTKFKFPFAITAGANFDESVHVKNFWAPPRQDGQVLPVRYWKNRSHFHWVFPVGTVIGEVLNIQAPDTREWYTFEIRMRVRERDGWRTYLFRPFSSAREMSVAIKRMRPNWESSDLASLVRHLENSQSLQRMILPTESFAAIVPNFEGAMDYLPETRDYALIREFLTQRTFTNVMRTQWKTNGRDISYAPSTKAEFHIVPKDFIGGMLKTTEDGCKMCHDQTGRPLGNLSGRIVLYGEVWGEDQIFTWHPFEINKDAFTVSDGSRKIDQRLLDAGLLREGKPSPNEAIYNQLPLPYQPKYE